MNRMIMLAVAWALLAAGPVAAEPLRVCATTPDLGSLVTAVGGDEVAVTVFAKGTEDPHFVEARPSFVKALSEAQLLVLGRRHAPVAERQQQRARTLGPIEAPRRHALDHLHGLVEDAGARAVLREVAEGDLKAKPVFASRDELGGLTRAFARMTEQLAEAREQVGRGVSQLEGARTRLQTILDSLSAGVIVFDREGRIDTVNPGATRILRVPVSAYRGRPLADVPGLQEFAAAVAQRFELHRSSPEAGERDHWQDAFDLQTTSAIGRQNNVVDGDKITLLVRGASMPHAGQLMVFDDITEVVSAQRAAAWSEVGARLRRISAFVARGLAPTPKVAPMPSSRQRTTGHWGARVPSLPWPSSSSPGRRCG